MIQAALLAVVVFLGVVQVWHIVVLSLILGVINAFDTPIRQSFVVEMVDYREDLGNAIALNSSLVNAGRLIGPAIAGILVATVGEGVCFMLNSISYLAVIMALVSMRITARPKPGHTSHLLHELKAGVAYAFGFGPIRSILILIAIVSLMGMPYAVLIPVFASKILVGGAHTYGFLMTATGCGSLVGTLYLASRKSVVGLGRIIARATVVFAAGVAAFALSQYLYLSLIALAFAGFGAMILVASSNTILQTIVEEEKRGRVMSLFTMAFMGMTPLGSLCAGFMAKLIGVQETLLLGSTACLGGAVLFTRQLPYIRESVRPIYVRMGIIPEVASGMESAAEQPSLPEEESG
jgi:MFS family permease